MGKSSCRQKVFRLVMVFLSIFIVSQRVTFSQVEFLSAMESPLRQQPLAHDWPGFLGPNRDGRSREKGIRKDWSNGKLEIVWRRKLGAGYCLGSTAMGKYYQLDAEKNICRLTCLDERTGHEIWNFDYEFEYEDLYGFDNGPRAAPLVNDGLVYIYGVAGMLHCLDANNGKVVWKVDTKKKFGVVQNFFGVGSSPLVKDDKLLVMVGGSPAEDQAKANRLDDVSPNSSGVVIFDKKSGAVLHRLLDDLASYSSINLYDDEGDTQAVAWMRNKILGFDFNRGEQLWSFPYRARKYESVNASTPVVQGTQIFLSESYGPGSMLLEVKNGMPKVIWKDENIRNRSLATHWNTPVYHRGHLFACHGENRANAEIRCIEWQTGKVRWKQSGYSRSSLTFVDEHFVVLDETGELFLIEANPREFKLVTQYSDANDRKLPLQYPCWAAPVISNGLLFVRGKNELICLALTAEATAEKQMEKQTEKD